MYVYFRKSGEYRKARRTGYIASLYETYGGSHGKGRPPLLWAEVLTDSLQLSPQESYPSLPQRPHPSAFPASAWLVPHRLCLVGNAPNLHLPLSLSSILLSSIMLLDVDIERETALVHLH